MREALLVCTSDVEQAQQTISFLIHNKCKHSGNLWIDANIFLTTNVVPALLCGANEYYSR